MRIATLTLNPALDVTTCTPKVRPTHKLRCTPPRFDPGGGGINVARAIHNLGGEAVAVFPSGGPAGARIEQLLRDAGVPIAPVPITGNTRESFTVDEGRGGDQYRFVLPGPELSAEEIDAVLAAITGMGTVDYLVVSGSLPPGCDPAILTRLAGLGARLVVDTSGPALAACEGAGVWLLKPSLRELEDLLGRTLDSEDAELAAANELRARGFAEVVVLSLGERGVLMVADGDPVRLPAIPVDVHSTVGAGDSMVGAITLALSQGKALEDALRHGLAAGAATLMTPATELAHREDVERLYASSV
jgi:6-phosphofructokinase 2